MPPTTNGLDLGLNPSVNGVEGSGQNGAGGSTSSLEQFLILSKATRGLAAVELIKQVLEHPQIFVFGELLDQPNIVDLEKVAEHEPFVRLLKLFAFGVYSDFVQNEASLPAITNAMRSKLRYLTIVSLAC